MKSLRELVSLLSCENLLECVYGLNSNDVEIYRVISSGLERVEEISRATGKSGSAVYKSIQKLVAAGIVYRVKVTMNGGGYYYIYRAVPKERLAEDVIRIVDEFCSKVRRTVEEMLG